jgi:hypothetical protein
MDVAGRLKEYAETHVETINKEYTRQTDKWKVYLNLFADAQATARQNLENTLAEIKRQKQEADRLMMLATSVLLTGVAAWVGAVIELKLYPRYMSKKLLKISFEEGRMVVKTEHEYSEVAAKFFGDFTHENLGHAFDSILEKVWPKSEEQRKVDAALGLSAESGNIGTFKSNLENALLGQSAVVVGQLGTLSENINQYKRPEGGGFGEAVVEEVLRRIPRMKGVSNDVADRAVESNGQRMLDEYFNGLRQKFAGEWFYYGNNPRPGSLHKLPFFFEIETWAFWLLSQEWRSKYIGTDSDYPDVSTLWVTKDDEDIDLDSVMEALLAVARGQENSYRLDMLAKPRKPLGTQRGWIQEIDVDADDAERTAETLEKAADWRTVGEDERLTRMLAWAKSVPGTRLHGTLDYVSRRIGSIADPASVFAD